MAKLKENGLGVFGNYGTRSTAEARVGDVQKSGNMHEQEYDLRGNATIDSLVGKLVKGCTVKDVLVDVVEPFVGITALDIGKKGSEAVDGFSIPVTVQGQSVISAQGELAAILADDVELASKSTGTPDGKGRVRVVVRYLALSGSKPV